MAHPWPLYEMRVRTPKLELRYPTEDDICTLLLASEQHGVHDPALMPFLFPWTEATGQEYRTSFLQHHWALRAEWKPTNWVCGLFAYVDGRPVANQGLSSKDFAVTKRVETGSWLLRSEQGKGLGTEMRRAVLGLSFLGLGADVARSGYMPENAASKRVSEKMGYELDGTEEHQVKGALRIEQRVKVTRERWLELGHDADIEIDGLDACSELFGIEPAAT